MLVKRIQNDNINFNAKLRINGCIEDIESETKKIWEQKAAKIGQESDMILIHFGSLMTERGDHFKNGKFYPWFASLRTILASAIVNSKKPYDKTYIGYRVLNQPHSKELTNKIVMDLNTLGNNSKI